MKKDGDQAQPLAQVVSQTEHASNLVGSAASELKSVNAVLGNEVAQNSASPVVQSALEKNNVAAEKVHEASGHLSEISVALQGQVAERQRLEDELTEVALRGETDRHAALHDGLTGLPNRALFNDRLTHGIAQAERHGRMLAVMFIDLDRFKAVNDTHGHEVGDRVLRMVAARLGDITRGDDTMSRFGGDEFLCLLTEVASEDVIGAIAKKIIASIQVPCEIQFATQVTQIAVSATIGIAIFPKDGVTAAELISNADKAMYRSKGGLARFAFAE
jgi:diguanylate cyclase (GGDEF)-like protein